jgi:hypothetical protein
LWTASHSLGFIEYTNEAQHAVLIDLDNLNFDLPQRLIPADKSNYQTYEIAIPKESLSVILKGKRIVFAERSDAKFYNLLCLQDILFLDAVDRNDVYNLVRATDYDGLVDRDYITDEERKEIMNLHPRLFILYYYCFENYLYHPDNIEEVCRKEKKKFDKSEYIGKIQKEKDKMLVDIASRLFESRKEYAYFKESDQKRRKIFVENKAAVLDILKSNDFETFYKVFSMKDCSGEIRPQNIKKDVLVSTLWFKNQIQNILIQKI